jgi:hypothetical protein
MQLNVVKEVAALRRLTTKELQVRYSELFGERTLANNRSWLIKRVGWRMQAQAEGDLSERARQRAAELANESDLRLSPPKDSSVAAAAEQTCARTLRGQTDDRLPPPGSIICREYKGEVLQIRVRADGFEFEGQYYRSLSAVAKAITGAHCNGYLFFRLPTRGAQP